MKVIKQFLIFFVLVLQQNLFSQSNSSINWQEDLEYYVTNLESKHIDLYNKISKADFKKQLLQIQDLAKTGDDFSVILELMRLIRQIGDGHTAISLQHIQTQNFPFKVRYIDGKWRVVKVIKPHEKILKATLIAVDGIPVDEVANKVSEVAQFVENEYSKTIRTGDYMTISEVLYALNITKDKNMATFTFRDDNDNKYEIELMSNDENETSNASNYVELTIGDPAVKKPEDQISTGLWYAPIAGTQAVYVQFNQYPSFENMQAFGTDLVKYIVSNNIKQVVIDMRNNGGGDLYVGVVLAYALNLADTIDWNNGVYVMTDAITFSAATSNTALFKQLLNAKTVGQPTGSNPTGYQDMGQFELPSSKLIITYSKRLFKLSEHLTQGVIPDVLLEYDWNDYANGRDTMLHWMVSTLKQ